MNQFVRVFIFSLLLTAISVSTFAQEYTSRREIMQDEGLRRDFALQGEYKGKIGDAPIGLQLIADGDSKFRLVCYLGGLPGDGWNAGEIRVLGKAEAKDSEITFTPTEFKGKRKDGKESKAPDVNESLTGKIVIERPQGRPADAQGERGNFRGLPVKIEFPATDKFPGITFEKVYRQSPTLSEKAPEGATVIFDGTNLDKFEDGAKMNEPERGPKTLWAEATAKPFENNKPYRLHLEFMLSYMPKASGQGRSNSGVYIYQAYECQVLDSFGLEGENNECGGFYQVSKPIVNMCFPPLTWQTYDFDFTPAKYEGDKKVENARITVKHNGVMIHDNIEFQKETPGCLPEGPGPRGLYTQGHGNKVQFRNIWVQYK